MTSNQRVIQTGAVPRSGRRPRTIESDRRCQNDDCETVLSRYNLSEWCSVHAPLRFPRVRGRISQA